MGERLAYKPMELVALLGLSRWTIYRLLSEGRLSSIRVGGRIVIPKTALERFLDEGPKEIRA